MKKATLLTALASATAILLSGCGSTPSEDDVRSMFSELMQRPDVETMETEYAGLLQRIRQRLVDDVGIKPFVPDEEGGGSSACPGEMSQVYDAQVRYIRSGFSPGSISEADWPRALRIVADMTAEQDFQQPKTVVDRVGDHEVAIYDKYGAELIFGTAKNTVLSLTTGCHLTREAHQRGEPKQEDLPS